MGHFTVKTIGYLAETPRCNSDISHVDNLLKSLANIFFPQFCINCKKIGAEICLDCLKITAQERLDFPLCLVCENLCINGELHHLCRKKSVLSRYLSTYTYTGITKKILQQKSKNPTLLKHLLTSDITEQIPRADLIIPIPPTPKPFNPRTIEPNSILSLYIKTTTHTPIIKALYKTAFSKQQKNLSATRRQSPSIRIKRETIPLIKNKRTLLIDDVCTTGATLNTSAKLLKHLGAREIMAYTLARDLKY